MYENLSRRLQKVAAQKKLKERFELRTTGVAAQFPTSAPWTVEMSFLLETHICMTSVPSIVACSYVIVNLALE